MDNLSMSNEPSNAHKECNSYEIINAILSQSSYHKEEIKSEIEKAIHGCDYVTAVVDYLWQGYNNGDPRAKTAFTRIFFDDVKAGNPELFSFFSFYFMNDLRRRGFDRRIDNSDRRTSYSLDYFSGDIRERRTGMERRQGKEQRSHWTRVTTWVSVPFTAGKEQRTGVDMM
jgi:hypothetical protein